MQWVTIVDLLLANSCPIGHVYIISVPKDVSLEDAIAPFPTTIAGQSEEIRKDALNIYLKEVRFY